VKNPLHQIVRDNAILLRAFARELGLTPSARTGLTGTFGEADDDPLEAWLRRGP
jgi:phage terminase small subunit